MDLTRNGKEIVFIWVTGHVGVRGDLAADSAAKDALVGDISVELIPFSDLKSCANKWMLELLQSEWDEFPKNKLHEYFQILKSVLFVLGQTEKKRLR